MRVDRSTADLPSSAVHLAALAADATVRSMKRTPRAPSSTHRYSAAPNNGGRPVAARAGSTGALATRSPQ